jgi:hypothetical protein
LSRIFSVFSFYPHISHLSLCSFQHSKYFISLL